MNRYTNLLLYVGLIVITILTAKSVYGLVELPWSVTTFRTKLAQSAFAVVHFVHYEALPRSSGAGEQMPRYGVSFTFDRLKAMEEAFSDTSQVSRYERVPITFIGVDLAQIPRLAEEYDLKGLSTLMLFKNGIPYRSRGVIAKTDVLLTTRIAIKDFIDTYLSAFIDRTTQRQKTRVTYVSSCPEYSCNAYCPASRYSYGYPGYWSGYDWRYPYWNSYGYWGYPYWGAGFGYSGGRGGFGVSFGW